MTALYRIGLFLLIVAALLLLHECYNAFVEGGYRLIALGEIWFRVDRMMGTGTLNLMQAVVQRYLWPWIWEDAIQNILLLPAWVVFGAPGLLMFAVGASSRRRR